MSDIDLTGAVEAATDAVMKVRDAHPRIATDADSYDVAEAAITAALPHIERQVREQVAREILSDLPAVLITTARDEDGWASDMQDAQLRLVDDEWVAFCGEGAVDIRHIAEHAARIARGEQS